MKTTIKDIAMRANVSITTVSRVINQKTDGMSETTRRRVLEIIQEMNYHPNKIARSMITKRTNTIGLIIPDIRNPFFPELVRGVEDVAKKYHYNVFLCNTDEDIEREESSLRLLRENHVDGIVFANSYTSKDRMSQGLVYKPTTPIVLIDRGLDDEMFSSVYVDNEKAGYLGTKHLIDLQHVKIGCITGPGYTQNTQYRLNGYLKALEEASIPINKDLILSGDFRMEGGYHAAKILLNRENVTAIFAHNDLMAFGVYQAASELGVNIPGDLSVVGIDNIKYNQLLNPGLTTIEQSVYKMGETAAQILFEQIEEGGESQRVKVNMEPTLIVRNSTKGLPSMC
ncbi:LacI family DNA-binding transcriptional regulator [Neobacillus sp. 19]|uniref:LacI family DNA-binding transcriptional regulator n=1 Tax=Neobacillus sp. 19 TaxID=3394458 RepID=UPI003BF68131